MDPILRERLSSALDAAGIAAEVVITQNRATMVSVRAKRTRRGMRELDREVRVAQRFAALGDEAIAAIVDFVSEKPGAGRKLQAMIAAMPGGADEHALGLRADPGHVAAVPYRRARREPPLRTAGLHHDLAELAEAERAAYLPALERVPVAWGRREGRPRRRLQSIRLGSYEPSGPLIKIHPRLDDPRVPAWFIGFVIFHELLHHALGIRLSPRGDRRELHPPAFKEAEAAHPRYADALAWEEQHINALLAPEW